MKNLWARVKDEPALAARMNGGVMGHWKAMVSRSVRKGVGVLMAVPQAGEGVCQGVSFRFYRGYEYIISARRRTSSKVVSRSLDCGL